MATGTMSSGGNSGCANCPPKLFFCFSPSFLISLFFQVMMRKITIIFVTVFLSGVGPGTQALVSTATVLFALVLHTVYDPFEDKILNLLEKYSLVCTSATMYSGFFFFTGELSEEISYGLGIFVIVMNALFISLFAYVSRQEIADKIVEIRKSAGSVKRTLGTQRATVSFLKGFMKNKVVPEDDEPLQFSNPFPESAPDVLPSPEKFNDGSDVYHGLQHTEGSAVRDLLGPSLSQATAPPRTAEWTSVAST
jgi:hypothetical protein